MNLWNRKDLSLPPINSYKANGRDIDIGNLYNASKDLQNFFLNNKYMHAEYLVLSRIVYRMKQKFRTAKDFKALEKLYKTLQNFFNLKLVTDIQYFMDLIPSRYSNETYLPTKNLLDYILVRMQGIAKLMERTVETCKITSYLLEQRIRIGQFWKQAVILFSLVSRIYVLAKYVMNGTCEFYRKLLPFSGKLKNVGNDWLPENYLFPTDLKKWVNADWLDLTEEIQTLSEPLDIPQIVEYFDLIDDDIQIIDEYVMVGDQDDEVEEVGSYVILGKEKTEHIDRNLSDNEEIIISNDSVSVNRQVMKERKLSKRDKEKSTEVDIGEIISERKEEIVNVPSKRKRKKIKNRIEGVEIASSLPKLKTFNDIILSDTDGDCIIEQVKFLKNKKRLKNKPKKRKETGISDKRISKKDGIQGVKRKFEDDNLTELKKVKLDTNRSGIKCTKLKRKSKLESQLMLKNDVDSIQKDNTVKKKKLKHNKMHKNVDIDEKNKIFVSKDKDNLESVEIMKKLKRKKRKRQKILHN